MLSSSQILIKIQHNQEELIKLEEKKIKYKKGKEVAIQEQYLIQEQLRKDLKDACLKKGEDALVNELMGYVNFAECNRHIHEWKNILLYACYGGYRPLVDKLLNYVKFEEFSNVRISDQPKSQNVLELKHGLGDPIHAAMLGDQAAVVDFLIEKIIEPIEKEIANLTFHEVAARSDLKPQKYDSHRDATESILKEVKENKDLPRKVVIDNTYDYPFRRLDGLKLVPDFLKSRRMSAHKSDDYYSQHQPLLIEAGVLGSIETVKMLINKYKVSLNTPYYQPQRRDNSSEYYREIGDVLTATIIAGQNDVSLFLINQGALVDSNHNNIEVAVDSNNLAMVKILLEQDPKIIQHIPYVKVYENTDPQIKQLIEDKQKEVKLNKERREIIQKNLAETSGWQLNFLERSMGSTKVIDKKNIKEIDSDHVDVQIVFKPFK